MFYPYIYFQTNRKLTEQEFNPKEENQNLINQKILDAIIDDDNERFIEIISQLISDDSDPNKEFTLTNYKLPEILSSNPSYASVCAFFGSEKCFSALSMLLPDGCDSSSMKNLDKFRRSPIHFACFGGNLNIIRELDRAKYDLKLVDLYSFTPSCYASISGNLDVIKYLWAKGAVSLSNINQLTQTFYVACLYGNLNIVKFIIEKVILTLDERSAKKQLNLLFTNKDFYNATCLHFACEGGNDEIVRYLLSFDVVKHNNVNVFDVRKMTPLAIACQSGFLNCAKILIEEGQAALNLIKTRYVPLISAAECGHLDIVQYLLRQEDIDVQFENTNKLNAIQAAILNKHIDIINCLIDNGALEGYDDEQIASLAMEAFNLNDIDLIKDLDEKCTIPYLKEINSIFNSCIKTYGDKFMQQAFLLENQEIVSFLLTKDCGFEHINMHFNFTHDWSPFMDFLITKGLDFNKTGKYDIPKIVDTVKNGNLKRIKTFISKGIILNSEIISKFNCVYSSIESKKLNLFNFLMSYNPQISNVYECIERCISEYSDGTQKTKNSCFSMLEKIFQSQHLDMRENACFKLKLCFSLAASISLNLVKLFEKYGYDISNCYLNFEKMKSDDFLATYLFLEERGCKFDKSIAFDFSIFSSYSITGNSAIEQLLRTFTLSISQDVVIFVLNYSTAANVLRVKNFRGNIVDNLMGLKFDKALLKVFQKVNDVIFPLKADLNCFKNWIYNSQNNELIQLYKNKICF